MLCYSMNTLDFNYILRAPISVERQTINSLCRLPVELSAGEE